MHQPLSGITVIEGASFIAGPSCGLYLAQLGATVIRFDQIGGGPDYRRWPLAPSGDSLYWEGLNKGKLSVALDLSRAEGRALAQRLATAADGIFLTNFPVDGFLAFETLAAMRPDLLCLRIMGWPDGAPAVDYTVNAALGFPMLTGPAGDARPINHVLPAWDLLTGAYAATVLLAALLDRQKNGQGREMRIALSDVAAIAAANIGMVGEALRPEGMRPRIGNALYGSFGRDFTTRDGVAVMLVALTTRHWRGLVEMLGIAEPVAAVEARNGLSLDEEGARFRCRAEIEPLVETAIAAMDFAPMAGELDRRGISWARYRPMEEAVRTDPRLFTQNPLFTPVEQPSGMAYPVPGAAVRFGTEPPVPARGAHRLGADTEHVLDHFLGIRGDALNRLRTEGIVA